MNQLLSAFESIKNRKDLRDLLLGLFTPQELVELETRLQIVKRLKAGIPQHKIAQDLKVGVATVTRGSMELQKGRFQNI